MTSILQFIAIIKLQFIQQILTTFYAIFSVTTSILVMCLIYDYNLLFKLQFSNYSNYQSHFRDIKLVSCF